MLQRILGPGPTDGFHFTCLLRHWFIKGYSCVVGNFDSKQKLEKDKKRLIKVKLLIYFLAYCIAFENDFSTLVFFSI